MHDLLGSIYFNLAKLNVSFDRFLGFLEPLKAMFFLRLITSTRPCTTTTYVPPFLSWTALPLPQLKLLSLLVALGPRLPLQWSHGDCKRNTRIFEDCNKDSCGQSFGRPLCMSSSWRMWLASILSWMISEHLSLRWPRLYQHHAKFVPSAHQSWRAKKQGPISITSSASHGQVKFLPWHKSQNKTN